MTEHASTQFKTLLRMRFLRAVFDIDVQRTQRCWCSERPRFVVFADLPFAEQPTSHTYTALLCTPRNNLRWYDFFVAECRNARLEATSSIQMVVHNVTVVTFPLSLSWESCFPLLVDDVVGATPQLRHALHIVWDTCRSPHCSWPDFLRSYICVCQL